MSPFQNFGINEFSLHTYNEAVACGVDPAQVLNQVPPDIAIIVAARNRIEPLRSGALPDIGHFGAHHATLNEQPDIEGYIRTNDNVASSAVAGLGMAVSSPSLDSVASSPAPLPGMGASVASSTIESEANKRHDGDKSTTQVCLLSGRRPREGNPSGGSSVTVRRVQKPQDTSSCESGEKALKRNEKDEKESNKVDLASWVRPTDVLRALVEENPRTFELERRFLPSEYQAKRLDDNRWKCRIPACIVLGSSAYWERREVGCGRHRFSAYDYRRHMLEVHFGIGRAKYSKGETVHTRARIAYNKYLAFEPPQYESSSRAESNKRGRKRSAEEARYENSEGDRSHKRQRGSS